MKMFSKKEKIILWSEQQKQDFVEKLKNAHVKYTIRTDWDNAPGDHPVYVVRMKKSDLPKVV